MEKDRMDEGMDASPPRHLHPPSLLARCEQCGSDELTSLPTFATGAGIAYRPLADDVYCRRCGHIGQPVLTTPDMSL